MSEELFDESDEVKEEHMARVIYVFKQIGAMAKEQELDAADMVTLCDFILSEVASWTPEHPDHRGWAGLYVLLGAHHTINEIEITQDG